MKPKDQNLDQISEQVRATTRMMKQVLDNIDLEAIDLGGKPGSAKRRRFTCLGTFGTFGSATGCFGTCGSFGTAEAKGVDAGEVNPTGSKSKR
jgi:hypothetical protein